MNDPNQKSSLNQIAKAITYHETELQRLRETYDRKYALDVYSRNDAEAGLTINQILYLVQMTEGTLRNRMSDKVLRPKVIKIDGKSGLRYGDVKKHLLRKSSGRISQERIDVILNLRNTIGMTQEQISETLGLSRRTIQRVLAHNEVGSKDEDKI